MKNASMVESICESLAEQERFFALSSAHMQLDARIDAMSIKGAARDISSELQGCGDCPFERVSTLLESAAKLFSRDNIRTLVLEELHRFSQSPIYNVSANIVDSEAFSGLVLYQDTALRISLVSLLPISHRARKLNNPFNDKPRGVTIQGMDSVIYFVASGNASLKVWEAQPFGRDEPLEFRDLSPPKMIDVADGVVLPMQGGRHGMSIKTLRGSMLFVMATFLLPRTSVNAHYVADTGKIHSFTAAEMRSSRIQLLATLLRELGGAADEDVLFDLLDNSEHFVRWHVMRELLAIYPERAMRALNSMASNDVHPQVREVAQKTLSLIEGVNYASRD